MAIRSLLRYDLGFHTDGEVGLGIINCEYSLELITGFHVIRRRNDQRFRRDLIPVTPASYFRGGGELRLVKSPS
jgi:hypothetical protein